MKLVYSAPVRVPPDPLADAVDLVVRQVADVVRRVAELEAGYKRLAMDTQLALARTYGQSGGPAVAEKGARVRHANGKPGTVHLIGVAGITVKWDDGSGSTLTYEAFARLRAAT